MPITDVVLMFIVTSGIGMILTIARLLYKSKCISIECCGCKIVRDVDVEEHEDHERRMISINRGENNDNEGESIST